MVSEVCRIFCATANPVGVIVAEKNQGKGVLGVIDGFPPKGIEGEADVAWRKNLLRQQAVSREPHAARLNGHEAELPSLAEHSRRREPAQRFRVAPAESE